MLARTETRHGDIGIGIGVLPVDFRYFSADMEQNTPLRHHRRQKIERHAILRQALRVWFDADLVGAAADDIAQADILDLGEVVLQFFRDKLLQPPA